MQYLAHCGSLEELLAWFLGGWMVAAWLAAGWPAGRPQGPQEAHQQPNSKLARRTLRLALVWARGVPVGVVNNDACVCGLVCGGWCVWAVVQGGLACGDGPLVCDFENQGHCDGEARREAALGNVARGNGSALRKVEAAAKPSLSP